MSQNERILVQIEADGREFAIEMGKMTRAVEGFQKSFKAVTSGGSNNANALSAISAAGLKASAALKEFNQQGTKMDLFARRMKTLKDMFQDQIASTEKYTQAHKAMSREMAATEDEIKQLTFTLKTYIELRNNLSAAPKSAGRDAAIKRTEQDIKDVTAVLATSQAKFADQSKRMDQYVADARDMAVAMDRVKTQVAGFGIALDAALKKLGPKATADNIVAEFARVNQELTKLTSALASMNPKDTGYSGLKLQIDQTRKLRDEIAAAIAIKKKLDETKLRGEELAAQQKEMDAIRSKAIAQRNYYADRERFAAGIAKLRSKQTAQENSEIALAKRLITLEAQLNQAINKEVVLRRTAAEAARIVQDVQVKAGVDKIITSQSTAWQKLGIVMASVGQIWTRQNLLIGSMGRALIKNSAAATVTTGRLVNLGNVIGVIVVGIQRFNGVIINTIKNLGKFAMVLGAGAAGAVRALLNVLNSAMNVLGRFGRATTNSISSLARVAAGFITARFAAARYRKEMGDTVDAEGWHSRSLKGLVGNAVNMNRWINTLGSSIRQLGQAFQNTGTTMSIFLSYPITNVLKGWWESAVAFDKSLIEVRKNADIALDGIGYSLQNVKKELMTLAETSPTQLPDLGKMAADAARLGIPPQFISSFTHVMDMLITSTNITADNAVDDIGRITTIFYDMSSQGSKDIGKFMKFVTGLGSAINELGQANPISESELIAAALRVAPAAKAIGMSVQDMLGLAASVASGSASPERAGTQLAAALAKVAENIKKIAAASGEEIDTLTNMATEDPAETFIAIASAVSKIQNPIARTNAQMELFGAIGGKATGIVSAGLNKTTENVALARKSFEDGTSLASEYARAMDAVSNQMALLKNQIGLVGMSLADAFLPVVTEILSYAVPAVRAFAKWFSELSDKVKLTTVSILGFVAVLGPILYAFGSMMFSVGIMITGLTGLATIFGKLIGLPLQLAASIFTLLSPLGLFRGILLATIAIFAVFGDSLGSLGQLIHTFATKMYEWGSNLFASFAEGIMSSATYILDAVVSVLDGMAMMLKSFSPPREGPLQDIDTWGANVAKTFADAFEAGDISGVYSYTQYISDAFIELVGSLTSASNEIVDLVSPIINSIVRTIGAAVGATSSAIDSNMRGALMTVIDFVGELQNGAGNFGNFIGELSKYVGNFAEDIANLVQQQEAYVESSKKIKDIQDELDNLDANTDKKIQSIAGTQGLSVSERIALINQAKREAVIRREQLEDEKKAAEERQQLILSQIDATKRLIDVLLQLTPTAQAEDDSGGIGGIGTQLDQVTTNLDNLSKTMSEKLLGMSGDLGKFSEKMSAATEKLRGFIDAIRGVDAEGNATTDYLAGFAAGDSARQKYLGWLYEVQRVWIELEKQGGNVSKAFAMIQEGINNPLGVFDPKKYSEQIAVLGPYAEVLFGIGQAISLTSVAIGDLLTKMRDTFIVAAGGNKGTDTLWTVMTREMQQFVDNFKKAFGENSGIISAAGLLFGPLESISGVLALIAGYAFGNIDWLGTALGTVAGWATQLLGVAGAIASIALSISKIDQATAISGWIFSVAMIKDLKIQEILEDAFSFGDKSLPFGQRIVDYIVFQIEAANWGAIGQSFADKINEILFGGIKSTYSPGSGLVEETPFNGLVDLIPLEKISNVVGPILTALVGFFERIDWDTIGGTIAEIINEFGSVMADLDLTFVAKEFFKAFARTLGALSYEDIIGAVSALIGAIVYGLFEGINSKDLDIALKNFAGALVQGIADLPWATAVEGIGTLATSILEALANAPWGALGDSLSALLTSLLTELSKPALWGGLGGAIGGIAGAIGSAITTADWGKLFNAGTMIEMAKAFLSGFTGAMISASNGSAVGSETDRLLSTPNNQLSGDQQRLKAVLEQREKWKASGQQMPLETWLQNAGWGVEQIGKALSALMDFFATPAKASGSDGIGLTGTLDLQAASDSGIQYGNAIIGGIRSALDKAPIDLVKPIFDGMSKFVIESGKSYYEVITGNLMGWVLSNVSSFNLIGSQVATSVYEGMSKAFSIGITYFNGIIFAGFDWVDSAKISLDAIGRRTAILVYESMGKSFESQLQYFNSIISGLSEWIIQNTQGLYNAGASIGSIVSAGVSSSLVISGASVSSAGISAASVSSAGVSAADIGVSSAGAQYGGITINVNVNGNWTVDSKERMEQIADIVSRKIAKDIKMSRGIK